MKAEKCVDANANRRPLLAAIFLVVMINLIDRQVINILAQDIKVELKLSDTQLGLLTGGAFGFIYALVGIPAAWFADRFDRLKVIVAMLAAWSAFTVLCGFATGFAWLMAARIGVGAGEGGGQPACTALVRDRFPDRPNTALAIMMAGNPLGSLVGFLAGGIIAQLWGWRAAFQVLGTLGLLLAAGMLWHFRGAKKNPKNAPSRSLSREVPSVLRNPGMAYLAIATSASLTIMYVGSAWLPALFIRMHGLTTGEMGLLAAAAVGVGGSIGALAGALADRAAAKLANAESKMAMLSLVGSLPGLALAITAPTIAAAAVGLFIFNLFAFLWLAPGTRLIQDAAAEFQRALAIAVCGGLGIMVSLGLAIPIVGAASDALHPSFGEVALGYSVFLVVLLASLIGIYAHRRRMGQLLSAAE